ncbi:MAG: sarcosine oxidase subunit gamma [Paracoccaceae bacterium]
MPELLAKPAIEAAPLTLAGLTLSVADPGPITLIAPFPGQEKAVAKALKPLGLTFPGPNAATTADDTLLVWTGRGQAALIGAPVPQGLSSAAAVTDQTDGWVALSLTGPRADQALMRLIPLDLRETALPTGSATRSGLNHMPMILIRRPEGFLIVTFRSMARTAWHELEEVLRHLDARDLLPG